MEQYADAVYIPVQAVLLVGGRPTAYVLRNDSFEARSVETGLDNNRMVRIIKGLQPGEVVSLAPPLPQAAVGEPASDEIPDGTLPATDSKPVTEQGSSENKDSVVSGRSGASSRGDLLRSLDKNNDRRVSREEFPGTDETFSRMDRNSDGYISKSDFQAGSPCRGRAPGRRLAIMNRSARERPSMGDPISPDDNIILIEDAVKIYPMGSQEVKALNGVTMSFRRGSFWAIMGPSGLWQEHHDEHFRLP